MKKSILILVATLFLSACAGTKKTVTETKEKITTSKVTETVKLDTVISIAAETSKLKIDIDQFEKLFEVKKSVSGKDSSIVVSKPTTFTQKIGRSTVTVKIDSTGITATSNCDSIAKSVDIYKQTIKQLRLQVTDTKIEDTKKRGYSGFELFLYILATAAVSFTAAYLLKSFKII